MFKVTAFCCPDGRKYEWTTFDKRAAELLKGAIRRSEDWVDVKVIEQPKTMRG